MTSLTQRLQIKQSQTLTLTPGLCQAISLLEMSNLDLHGFLTQQIEGNPLLSLDGDLDDVPQDDLAADPKDHDLACLNGHDYDNMWTNDNPAHPSPKSEWDNLYGSVGPNADSTLRAHVISQIEMAPFSNWEKIMAIHLTDYLDPCGYLEKELSALADRLKTPPQVLEGLLGRLQTFSPAGVFARNLSECLRLQIADKGMLTKPWNDLLDNLDLLGKGDLGAVSKKISLPVYTVREMVSILRGLNPKPGLTFEFDPVPVIMPDVFVFYDESRDEFYPRLNESTAPKITLRSFETQKNQDITKETNRIIGSYVRDGQFLLNALKQRAATIMAVSREIIRSQNDFFRHGAGHIKPMTLKDIACAIGVHESTVSRVTSNKYMATPRGTYELKYFFNSALSHTLSGGDHSSAAVKHRLLSLIEQEKAISPLSDEGLKKRLRIEGIDISRRTVTKYREELGVGTSYQRKRQKAFLQ